MRGILAVAVIALALAGCGQAPPTPAPDAGVRIVTLAPHLAELVFAAGAGESLVGVVAFSDYPPEVAALPQVGDAFRLDLEALSAVQPDLVLAWSGGNPPRMLEQLERLGYQVNALRVERVDDIARHLIEIGALAGSEDVASERAAEFRARLGRLRERHTAASPVRVFYQISARPLYTIGGKHVLDELIRICGGRNVFTELSELAPTVSVEAVLASDPQVIIAGDDAGEPALAMWRQWPGLAATDHGNLYRVEAALLARPATRLALGAEKLCATLEQARKQLAQHQSPDSRRDFHSTSAPRSWRESTRARTNNRSDSRLR